jgi:hypothetical protein
MKKIIRLTESDLNRIVKRVIEEQGAKPIVNVQKTNDNKLTVDGVKYKLQVDKGFMGWLDVDVDECLPYGDSYKIKASLGPVSKEDIVPSDTLRAVKNKIGSDKIELGGKTPKRLKKL